jgi:adenylate kinase
LIASCISQFVLQFSVNCAVQGVGKGTYSTRVADKFGFKHIATGDLVRDEIKKGSDLGKQMAEIVNSGQLLPDGMILRALDDQFHSAAASGVDKFLLDGFPRSVPQAAALEEIADVQLALNLDLREEVLVEKCMGRRLCSKCGKNYNIADINLAAGNGRPAIIMPPLSPPPECDPFMEQRSDDTEETILRRLEVYNSGAKPVEDFYRSRGTLVDFEITAGIPETLPGLLELLGGHLPSSSSQKAAAA